MANGVDPLQQFIQNHMAFENFRSQEQQFGAQMAMQQRQAENQEIQQFAALAPFVEQPEQRQALAGFFAQRNPQMAETFSALAQTIPVSEQVYRSRLLREGLDTAPGLGTAAAVREFAGQDVGSYAVSLATAGRSPEDIVQGQRVGEGQELTAGQLQQNDQFIKSFFEGQRQFDVSAAQRNRQLGQTDRQLGISEFEVAQRGELGRLNAMVSGGMLPQMLRAEHSEQLVEVEQALQRPNLTAEQRAGLTRRKEEIENAIRQLDNTIAAEFAPDPTGGMNLNQIIQATQTALGQVRDASSPGEKEVAVQNFNYLRALLNRAGFQGSMLEQDQSGWQRLLRVPGTAQAVPFDTTAQTAPFMPQQ